MSINHHLNLLYVVMIMVQCKLLQVKRVSTIKKVMIPSQYASLFMRQKTATLQQVWLVVSAMMCHSKLIC